MHSADAAATLYGPAPTAATASAAPAPASPASTAAEALYGTPAPATMSEGNPDPAPAKPTAPKAIRETPQQAEARVADALYGGQLLGPTVQVPDEIQKLRDADAERMMYNAQGQIGNAVRESDIFNNEAAASIAPEVQKAIVAEVREIAVDAGMNSQDVRNFVSLAHGIKEAPDEATRAAWRDQAIQQLNETYGQDAKKAASDAVRFAQRDPRLKAVLNTKGLGDHPNTILLMARLAREARSKGKFK